VIVLYGNFDDAAELDARKHHSEGDNGLDENFRFFLG
jgi:hypothetical protein